MKTQNLTNRRSKCIHCPSKPCHVRGMCVACYQAAYLAVRAGKTTWKKLEAKGLAMPAKSPPLSGFNQVFRELEAAR